MQQAVLHQQYQWIQFFISKTPKWLHEGLNGAIVKRDIELVEFFLRKGATFQEWMLHSARDETMLEYLEKVCNEPSMRAHITLAVRQNNLEKVKLLCKAINRAISREHRGWAEYFVKKGGFWDDCIVQA